MNEIFSFVYKLLIACSTITGLSYVEINIIVYYIILPGIFIHFIGKILRKKHLLLIFSGLIIVTIFLIPNFYVFSENLFEKSVVFLNWFAIVGLDYTQASVVICVFIPAIIIILLYYFNKQKELTNEKNRLTE
ncbi:hypothetical protein [Aureivirga sp. CE67]|uniref:hypothetical protein n=1 Tax=Aureivirga sp. CE67 TaxID=1788983 RepID=UPI0018CBDE5B|nr:hypothetical protein [Aureivirga sp. CE67]